MRRRCSQSCQHGSCYGIKGLTVLCIQVAKLMSDNLDAQLEATSYFRKLLSIEKRPPIEDVVKQPNVVRRLVEFLGYDHNQRLQFEAAWALTNVRVCIKLLSSACVTRAFNVCSANTIHTVLELCVTIRFFGKMSLHTCGLS